MTDCLVDLLGSVEDDRGGILVSIADAHSGEAVNVRVPTRAMSPCGRLRCRCTSDRVDPALVQLPEGHLGRSDWILVPREDVEQRRS